MASAERLLWIRCTLFLGRFLACKDCNADHVVQMLEHSLPSVRQTIDCLRGNFYAPLGFDRKENTWRLTDSTWDASTHRKSSHNLTKTQKSDKK